MSFTQKLFLAILGLIIVCSCNTGTKMADKVVNIRINQSGELFLQGLEVEYPMTFEAFVEILGPANRVGEVKDELQSKIFNVSFYNLEYYWDELGIKIDGFRFGSGNDYVSEVSDIILCINETKDMPKSRFVGKIDLPQGTVNIAEKVSLDHTDFVQYNADSDKFKGSQGFQLTAGYGGNNNAITTLLLHYPDMNQPMNEPFLIIISMMKQ